MREVRALVVGVVIAWLIVLMPLIVDAVSRWRDRTFPPSPTVKFQNLTYRRQPNDRYLIKGEAVNISGRQLKELNIVITDVPPGWAGTEVSENLHDIGPNETVRFEEVFLSPRRSDRLRVDERYVLFDDGQSIDWQRHR